MADWEEVKRLAADFQRAQLSSTKQKLSERNVIEIVSKLVEAGLIEVIYTVDGKEYLTPQELVKEIKEELFVHGGRINLVELQQVLNVDFSHVEAKVNEIVKHDHKLDLVLGQLIDKSYLDRLAEEVNDKLQEEGHVTIPDLTKQYDLPGDYLSENIHARVGSIINGKVDSYDRDVIFTDAFITRMKAQIRGAFSAITRPIVLGSIIQHYKFQERIFFSILEDLVNTKRLAGLIAGGRQEKATYIPDIYTKTQNQWVDSFYKQNGYLEYDSLLRLGITDPKGFIKKRYKSESIVYLSTCCAGRGLQEHIEASVEEALSDGSWVDIMPLLPSIFSPNDASQLLTGCLKHHPGALLCCDTIVASEKLVSECSKPFPALMALKAEKDAKSNPAFRVGPDGDKKGATSEASSSRGAKEGITKEDRKDQRRKKAATGSGSTKSISGTQGREVKTKSLKKKGSKGRDLDNDSDEENTNPTPKSRLSEIPFMTTEEIEEVIRKEKSLEDCPDELVTEIAQQLIRPLTKQYQDVAKSIFLQSAGADTSSARKKTHGELQEKLTGLWTNARLFEKGLKLLPEDTQQNLIRHLLRTVCTDITNLVLNAVATDHMMSIDDESQFNTESRTKIIGKLPSAVQSVMLKINTSLNGKSLDDFFNQLDVICGPDHLGILLKKPDKKKEKQLTFSHRQALCEQLSNETDPAMTLHLATVILFQKFTQNIVHIPGKCVPQLLMFLKDHLDGDLYIELVKLQDLVVTQLQKSQAVEETVTDPDLEKTVSEVMDKVKDIALTTKKSVQSAAAADG